MQKNHMQKSTDRYIHQQAKNIKHTHQIDSKPCRCKTVQQMFMLKIQTLKKMANFSHLL